MDFFGSEKYTDPEAFLVIDGVDEAPKRAITTLLRFVENLSQVNQRPRIQIALVGRPGLEEFASSVMPRDIKFLAMSSENNGEDIITTLRKGKHQSRRNIEKYQNEGKSEGKNSPREKNISKASRQCKWDVLGKPKLPFNFELNMPIG